MAGEEWFRAVSIRSDELLQSELGERLAHASGLRPVGVRDLLSLRQAFWSKVAPTPPDRERDLSMQTGALVHRRLGGWLGPDVPLEVKIRREGITGRLDALGEEGPIELKTTGFPVAVADLASRRPDQVEQLGVYCALLDRPRGRLIELEVREGHLRSAFVAELEFSELGRMRREIHRRAASLRSAWSAGTPHGLPACPWFQRRCEFRASGVCGCSGAEGSPEPSIAGFLRSIVERPDLVPEGISAGPPLALPAREPTIRDFPDLIHVRQRFLSRTRPAPPTARPLTGPWAANLWQRLSEAIESGPLGEVRFAAPLSDEPPATVPTFRGDPYLVKAPRSPRRPDGAGMLSSHPQYGLELGLRCVAIGRSAGTLVLGWENSPHYENDFQVLRLEFRPAGVFSRIWRDRARRLALSLADGTWDRLEACPSWMSARCPFQPTCGCPAELPRLQR